MEKKDEILEEARAMHNDICIVADSYLARLIGYETDAFDAYWRVVKMGGQEVYSSAVGACVSLRGIPRYEILDERFAKNGAPKNDEFLISEASHEHNVRMYGRVAIEGPGA